MRGRVRGPAYGKPTIRRSTILPIAFAITILPAPTFAQRIGGTVADRATGRPVAGALVQLIAPDSTVLTSVLTSDAGRFVLVAECTPRDRYLYVAGLGYHAVRISLDDLPDDCANWSIALDADALALPGVGVEVTRNRDLERVGFYNRQRLGFGTFITRAMIEDRYGTLSRVAEVFGQTTGVLRVQEDPNAYSVFFLRASRLRFDGPCPAAGYIDGLFYGTDLPRLSLHDVEAIEMYRGPSEVPAHYSGANAMCGVILIWTRTGTGH